MSTVGKRASDIIGLKIYLHIFQDHCKHGVVIEFHFALQIYIQNALTERVAIYEVVILHELAFRQPCDKLTKA